MAARARPARNCVSRFVEARLRSAFRRAARMNTATTWRQMTSVPRRKLSRLLLLFYAIGCSDLGEVAGERGQDLVGGLGPGERPGVVVPGGDPVPDVMFQGLDGGVYAAADQLVGQQAEPPPGLVHPR